MNNQYSVFSYGEEFRTAQFLDDYSSLPGVTVYSPNGRVIGEMMEISIPDLNEAEHEEINLFEMKVENWLEHNYW